jgi:hypothetical protein
MKNQLLGQNFKMKKYRKKLHITQRHELSRLFLTKNLYHDEI